MLYIDFVNKAAALTITQADNGLFYIEPTWRSILHNNNLHFSSISDLTADWNDIFNFLQLEVTKRNTISSKKPEVVNWLFDLITTQVDPAMLQEESDYIKQVTEFMKANHETQALK